MKGLAVLNLSVLREDSARSHPERVAVVQGEQRLTYADVDAAARQVAGLLAERGIRPGDKVALSCPNPPWFPIVYYGILKAGAVGFAGFGDADACEHFFLITADPDAPSPIEGTETLGAALT